MTAKKTTRIDQQIHEWLSPSNTQNCVSFSRALKKLRADCYSNAARPIPMTWPSRALPEWFVKSFRPEEVGEEESLYEQLHKCLCRDMKMLKLEIPRMLQKINLPTPPMSIFQLEMEVTLAIEASEVSSCVLDLQAACDFVTRLLDCAAYDRRELPMGWDMTHGWPESPIETPIELAIHLEHTRNELLQQFEPPLEQHEDDPEKYRRQLSNAHKAIGFWQLPDIPILSAMPESIAEAESQLSRLIARLRAYESTHLTSPKVDRESDQMESESSTTVIARDLRFDSELMPTVADAIPEREAVNCQMGVEPPQFLLHQLRGQKAKILRHLWGAHHTSKWCNLPDNCWRRGSSFEQEDRTILAALERLREALNRFPEFHLTLQVSSSEQTAHLEYNPPRNPPRK